MAQARKKNDNHSWWTRWFGSIPAKTSARTGTKRPTLAVRFLENGENANIKQRDPDVLVTMGRELAEHIFAHPEPYMRTIHGMPALVVGEAEYEALFYLFSGKTPQSYREQNSAKIVSLFLGPYPVLSQTLAKEVEQGW